MRLTKAEFTIKLATIIAELEGLLTPMRAELKKRVDIFEANKSLPYSGGTAVLQNPMVFMHYLAELEELVAEADPEELSQIFLYIKTLDSDNRHLGIYLLFCGSQALVHRYLSLLLSLLCRGVSLDELCALLIEKDKLQGNSFFAICTQGLKGHILCEALKRDIPSLDSGNTLMDFIFKLKASGLSDEQMLSLMSSFGANLFSLPNEDLNLRCLDYLKSLLQSASSMPVVKVKVAELIQYRDPFNSPTLLFLSVKKTLLAYLELLKIIQAMALLSPSEIIKLFLVEDFFERGVFFNLTSRADSEVIQAYLNFLIASVGSDSTAKATIQSLLIDRNVTYVSYAELLIKKKDSLCPVIIKLIANEFLPLTELTKLIVLQEIVADELVKQSRELAGREESLSFLRNVVDPSKALGSYFELAKGHSTAGIVKIRREIERLTAPALTRVTEGLVTSGIYAGRGSAVAGSGSLNAVESFGTAAAAGPR